MNVLMAWLPLSALIVPAVFGVWTGMRGEVGFVVTTWIMVIVLTCAHIVGASIGKGLQG